MKKYEWKYNIWTGDSTLKVNNNTRIIRIGKNGPYYKEFWGDYSYNYPIQSQYFNNLKQALACKF